MTLSLSRSTASSSPLEESTEEACHVAGTHVYEAVWHCWHLLLPQPLWPPLLLRRGGQGHVVAAGPEEQNMEVEVCRPRRRQTLEDLDRIHLQEEGWGKSKLVEVQTGTSR